MSAKKQKSAASDVGPTLQEVDEDLVRMDIHRALSNVKRGDAFVDGHLEESDFLKLQEGDAATLDNFFKYLVKSIVDREAQTLKVKKKTRIKLWEAELPSRRQQWIEEIRRFDDEAAAPVPEEGVAAAKDDKEAEAMDVEAEPVKQEPSKKRKSDVLDSEVASKGEEAPSKKRNEKQKKTKKPKKVESPKGDKKKSKGPKKKRVLKLEASEALMEQKRQEIKKEFEEEKADILAEVPEKIQKRWGQVGFAKWSKEWLPCLFVGPYDVSAFSGVREQWMQMFENVSGKSWVRISVWARFARYSNSIFCFPRAQTKNRRESMTHLVYWYGTADLSLAYSFIANSSIKTYEQGVEKGLDKPLQKVQKKFDSGKKLTKKEQETMNAFKALQEDLAKDVKERRNKEPIQENYENDDFVRVLITGEDDDSDGEPLEDDESGEELLSDTDDDDELVSDDESEDIGAEDFKPKKREKVSNKQRAVEVDEDEDIGEDEASSDDAKDEDVIISDEDDDDEENDEDFGQETKPKKKTPKSQKPAKGKKKLQRDRTSTGSTKRKERKDVTMETLRRREHKAFAENERVFLPILEQWKVAIDAKDVEAIEAGLRKALDSVDELTAPFMEEYKISPLMKTMKGVLKGQKRDTAQYKELLRKLQEVYTQKKPLVPPGYKPKKAKPPSKQKVSKNERKPEQGVSMDEDRKPESVSIKVDKGESAQGSSEAKLPETVLFSPKKRDPSQDSSALKSEESKSAASPKRETEDLSQGSKVSIQKSEKKSFSLSSLFNPKPQSSEGKSGGDGLPKRKSLEKVEKKLPSWMTSAPTDTVPLSSDGIDRAFAFEFLEGATSRFPEERVNQGFMARALEAAVYQWSREHYKKDEVYWDKIHAITAAICGKTEPGTLVASIMAGEYATAKEVIMLPEDVLLRSFES